MISYNNIFRVFTGSCQNNEQEHHFGSLIGRDRGTCEGWREKRGVFRLTEAVARERGLGGGTRGT